MRKAVNRGLNLSSPRNQSQMEFSMYRLDTSNYGIWLAQSAVKQMNYLR